MSPDDCPSLFSAETIMKMMIILRLIVSTEGTLKRSMTYNYNDHPNPSRIYSSITNGKLQTDSRKSRTTSNELIDIRQMHLNYILQDLFRDTPLAYI